MIRATRAVRLFDDFIWENDPYGEHDMGAFIVDGQRFFWKLDDYGEKYLTAGAPSRFVLTLMLAEEY